MYVLLKEEYSIATHPPSRVQKARQALVRLLSDEPGFVGAGVSVGISGQYEIIVLVEDAKSPVLAKVPSEWEGVLVRREIGGVPRKF